ncbi:MAG: hypothetical protein ACXAD7_06720 [Candidatus Kariarchaeaceae archaeon]|jgi:cytochrome c oxidase subunit 2
MNFLEQVKYTILAFLAVGVIGLLFLLGRNFETGGELTKFDFTEDKLNISRIVLLTWEFFWLTAIIIGAVWLARRATDKSNAQAEEKLENFEPLFFKIMIGVLILAAFFSLVVPAFVGDGLPHYRVNDEGEVVTVTASQYAFSITYNGAAVSAANPLETGVTYVFELRTTDTTHGFGLYDPDGVLLMQAQIVPGYTTNLVHTFDDAGTYNVRCMEYCGISHHTMEYPILEVVP